jgi:transposase
VKRWPASDGSTWISRISERRVRLVDAALRGTIRDGIATARFVARCRPFGTREDRCHALVRDRRRSREFIEFLKLLDAAYSAYTAIKLILDNHSAHISKETRAWIARQPAHRFEFTFTPTHGSWLNLIEGFFSKLTRSVLRHIRVASKQELKDRIMAAMDFFNREPVVHTWTYKLDRAV